MSTKILYRRILPCPSPPPSTQLTHPHKTLSPAPPSHTDTDTVTSTTNNDQTEKPLTPKPTTRVEPEHEIVSSTQNIETESESGDSIEELSSPVNEGEAVKVTLGETTEIKGVIFDMDGTLTIPVLRFLDIKAELGLKPSDDILPVVQKMPEKEKAQAFEIIAKFEREGVKNMKVSIVDVDCMTM